MLEAFSTAERALLPERIERAARAVEAALRLGVAAAMNEFNRDPDADRRAAMSDPPRRGFIDLLAGVLDPAARSASRRRCSPRTSTPTAITRIVHWRPFGDLALFGHALDLHYLVNDVFMVFFFGIAAKEITEACLPGGDLNPPAKAMNPLIATIGGVVGPVAAFFAGLALLFASASTSAASTTGPRSRAAGACPPPPTSRWRGSPRARCSAAATPRSTSCCCSRWSTTASASRSSRSSTAIPRTPRGPRSSASCCSGWRSRSRCAGSA